ncbi:restriction endonuclease subunit S [Acinetobacter variabilis]|jgi:type I restriction enzyme S subunit|uniref:restriction endonuclease subunit S n=1 Tax=Acinetobacter variabilis TaxID=70346 RepID=UPI001330D08B|nr:restriction endonuclease subunit S [Acinetobacter variabilis]
MEFKQYPSYKKSGVEWLGDVPEHWESNRLKKYLIERNEKNSPIKTDNLLSVTMYQGVIPVSEKQGNGGNKPKENLENYKISYPNDIVLNSMNVIVGSVGLNKYTGLISPAYYALYNRNKNNNIKFFSYIFHNPFFQKGLFGLGNGIMYKESEDGKLNTIRLKIPMEKLNQVVLPCPSISEQNQIVAFLDTETARIDNLISKQEKLIELLEEQRKSIISHAVTKGLNPNAPMKDSGVEWLGEVPEHWKIGRLKNLLSINNGSDYKEFEVENSENSYPVYGSGGVFTYSSKYIYDQESVLLGRKGTINKPLYVTSPFWAVDTMFYSQVKQGVHGKYVYYQALGFPYDRYSSNTALPSMTQTDLLNLSVVIPIISEQIEITQFLDNENAMFDNLISKQKKLIEKLKEYRASIISHAVTGKIDVREFGA